MPKLLSVRVKDADGYTHHVAHDIDEKLAHEMADSITVGKVELVDQSGKVVDRIPDTKARKLAAEEQAAADPFGPERMIPAAEALAPADE